MPPTVILDAQEHLEITLVAPRGNFLVKKFRAILPRHHCFMARFLFPSGVPLTGPPSQGPPCRAPPWRVANKLAPASASSDWRLASRLGLGLGFSAFGWLAWISI